MLFDDVDNVFDHLHVYTMLSWRVFCNVRNEGGVIQWGTPNVAKQNTNNITSNNEIIRYETQYYAE
jgi:hypothetical protein